MIVFLILSIYVFIKCDKTLFTIMYLTSLIFLSVFLFEVGFTNVQYLASDEWRFFHLSEIYLQEENDRTLWLYINVLLKNYDLFGEYFVKLLNIPLCVYLIHLVNSIFDIKNRLIVYLLAPFIIVLSISNLRDVLIFITTIHFCLALDKLKTINIKNLIYLLFSAFFLFTLRPIILFVSIGLYLIVNFKKYSKNFRNSFISIIFIIVVFLSIISFSSAYINKILYNGGYFLTQGIALKAELKGFNQYFYPNNLPLTFSYASLRYVFTPMPTSIVERLFSDHFYKHGIISEIVRLFHQLIYFYLLFYIFFNLKKMYRLLKKLNSLHKLILLNLLVYMPIYTIYAFGGVHQRTKFPFQLALIIIYVLYQQKKKNLITR
jgi:hypothetical protein